MIKAVIFDLDDTLISEGEYILSGYWHVSGILSKEGIERQNIFNKLVELFNDTPKNVFDRLLEHLQIPYAKKDILELVETYRNHEPNIKYYDDVIPCLKQLKIKGIKTGIISDGYITSQRNKLKVLSADQHFNLIITTDELGREYWKPNPRAFEIMRSTLQVEFDEMIYVGDNPEKDFYIGCIYPITTVRIERKGVYKDRNYYQGVKENYRIESLIEIIDLIERT